MENSQIGAKSVKRDDEEEVSKRKDEDAVEDVEVNMRMQWQRNLEILDAVVPDESTSCHVEASSSINVYSNARVCEQGVRGQTPRPPTSMVGRESA